MDRQRIRALGQLLTTYEEDLTYFQRFIQLSNGQLSEEKWVKEGRYTFQQFINGYKIARNVKKGRTLELLRFTKDWYDSGKSNRVDELADKLKMSDLTHKKRAASLASKIMFLMNPQEIIPMDRLNRNALKVRSGNIYEDFYEKLILYKQRHRPEIMDSLEKVAGLLEVIERPFQKDVSGLDLIRENRFLDKWLWVQGSDL